MSETFWVAIVGFISTLLGVFLGYLLQRCSAKRQREWELEDRKRELVRRQKEPQFDIVRNWVKTTITYLTHSELSLDKPLPLYSPDELSEKLKEWEAQAAEAKATIWSRLGDEKLGKLCTSFWEVAIGLSSAIREEDESKIDMLTDQMAKVAAEINRRIDKLWEETL
jgi:hypothetical protein